MRQMVCQRVAPDIPAGFAEADGHRGQRFSRRSDDDRQRHDRERQGRGEDGAGPMPREEDESAQTEKRVHNAGHAGQIHDREVHDAREPISFAYSFR